MQPSGQYHTDTWHPLLVTEQNQLGRLGAVFETLSLKIPNKVGMCWKVQRANGNPAVFRSMRGGAGEKNGRLRPFNFQRANRNLT